MELKSIFRAILLRKENNELPLCMLGPHSVTKVIPGLSDGDNLEKE